MNAAPDALALERLTQSTAAMVRTVDGLSAEELAAASLLPDWTRAHVVAHLALNAEGLAGVLDGLAHDREVPMYASDESRDADIEQLAGAEPAQLRNRLLAACTSFVDAIQRMPAEAWSRTAPRTPGGARVPAGAAPTMRRREVEIHHADLGAGYAAGHWPADFTLEMLDAVTQHHADDGPFTVRAIDLGREWTVGEGGGPVVSGSGADLGWWLTGRGSGATLAVEGGDLPRLGPWRAAPTRDRR